MARIFSLAFSINRFWALLSSLSKPGIFFCKVGYIVPLGGVSSSLLNSPAINYIISSGTGFCWIFSSSGESETVSNSAANSASVSFLIALSHEVETPAVILSVIGTSDEAPLACSKGDEPEVYFEGLFTTLMPLLTSNDVQASLVFPDDSLLLCFAITTELDKSFIKVWS